MSLPDFPNWRDILNLNLVNLLWTVPFLIGTLCTTVHLVWSVQRWRAVGSGRRSVQAAAFWFMRQDALNVVLGCAMTAAGVCVILRVTGGHVTGLLLVGAVAFCANKIWNLADDARVQFYLRTGRQRGRERGGTADGIP